MTKSIVFCMWPAASEMHASLGLARKLLLAGYDVSYLGIADCERFTKPEGIRLSAVLEGWFPKGSLAATDLQIARSGTLRRLILRRLSSCRSSRYLHRLATLEEPAILDALCRLQPDLVIVGVNHIFAIPFAYSAVHLGIRCCYFAQWLEPQRSSGDGERRIVRPSWRSRLSGLPRLGLDRWTNVDWRQVVSEFSRNYRGAPRDSTPELPVLYMWPRAFDMPGTEPLPYRYLGALIDRTRNESPSSHRSANRLVYGTLGTLLPLGNRRTKELLRAMIEAFDGFSGHELVLALGQYFETEDFSSVPPNVQLAKWLPQSRWIRNAAVVLSHGGGRTVTDCISLGVPMVVLPMAYDQPELAKRVEHFGLGLRIDLRDATAPRIRECLRQIEHDPTFVANCARMQRRFLESDESSTAVLAVEELLAPGPVAPCHSYWRFF